MSEKIEQIPIDDLLLDEDNPRLPADVGKTQEAMLDYIARQTSIEELMEAIGENGFFNSEALIVYHHPNDKPEKYRVIEGNRRLTAVKLLRTPELVPKRKKFVEISQEAKHPAPKTLPVVKHATREEVLPYLGSRHITGVKQWESIAKAKYINQLFEKLTDPKKTPEERYKQIAKQTGSRRDFIERNLDAYAVYKVIERNDFYKIRDLNEETINFSVLSTAIAYPKIGAFVGTTDYREDGTSVSHHSIVSPKHLMPSNIEELTRWCFEKGERTGTVRLGDSRNLKWLPHIVVTPKALKAFRDGADIQHAYRMTVGLDEEFREVFQQVLNLLRQASGMVANTSGKKEHSDLADDANEQIKLIRRTLQAKLTGDDD